MHTHVHTRTNKYTHAQTHMYKHIHTGIQMHKHAQMHTQAQIHAHTGTHAQFRSVTSMMHTVHLSLGSSSLAIAPREHSGSLCSLCSQSGTAGFALLTKWKICSQASRETPAMSSARNLTDVPCRLQLCPGASPVYSNGDAFAIHSFLERSSEDSANIVIVPSFFFF